MDRQNCRNCEDLRQTQDGIYWCEVTGGNIENMKKLPKSCPRSNQNCHNYCRYGKYCRYVDGATGTNPEECAMYYKIDDLLMDARDIKEEQERSRGELEEDW